MSKPIAASPKLWRAVEHAYSALCYACDETAQLRGSQFTDRIEREMIRDWLSTLVAISDEMYAWRHGAVFHAESKSREALHHPEIVYRTRFNTRPRIVDFESAHQA